MSRPAPISQGLFLGLCNTAVVALGLATLEPDGWPDMAFLVCLVGMAPGLATGAALGWLAGELAGSRVWIRRVWLIAPALLVVVGLGVTFYMREFIVVCSIPTTVGCLILERGTRRTPAVPVARVTG